jgi:octaprenyl-diphosphate synthase
MIDTQLEQATNFKKKDKKTLAEITSPVSDSLSEFRTFYKESLRTDVFVLDKVVQYLLRQKGKEIRPTLVFMSARLFGDITERSYVAATMIELLHTATLIHDDVVDEADTRRGFVSINKIWKNKAGVLLGDYLLSKGLLIALENREHNLLEVQSRAVQKMSEGELLQIEKARRLDITEAVYYDIIRQKTATLIAACCSLGAASVKPESNEISKMRHFGELIGMAFQIKDDLFDYGDDQIGKPTGIDIKEQKMTLPLIYVLNHCTPKEKSWVINSIKNHNKDKKRVKEVIAFVKDQGGLEYAVIKMKNFQKEALALLNEYPDSPYKDSLELMVNYVIERKK